jgi:hypothetical protein
MWVKGKPRPGNTATMALPSQLESRHWKVATLVAPTFGTILSSERTLRGGTLWEWATCCQGRQNPSDDWLSECNAESRMQAAASVAGGDW